MTRIHHTISPPEKLSFNEWAVYVRTESNKQFIKQKQDENQNDKISNGRTRS